MLLSNPSNLYERRGTFYHLERVSGLTTKDEYLNAAKKKPSNRTIHEQGLVDKGSNMQEVKNADYEAKRQEKIYGK